MQILSSDELKEDNQERRTMPDLQMPTFIRGDEDEDAEELFYLPPQPTTPACPTPHSNGSPARFQPEHNQAHPAALPQVRPPPPRCRSAAAGLNQPAIAPHPRTGSTCFSMA